MTSTSVNAPGATAGPAPFDFPDILTLLAVISCCLFVVAGLEYAKANAYIEIQQEERADETFVQAEVIASIGLMSFILAIPFDILPLFPFSLSLSISQPFFNISFGLQLSTKLTSSLLRIFLTMFVILLCMSNRDQSLFPQDWDTLTLVRHRTTKKHPYFQKWLDTCVDMRYRRQLESEEKWIDNGEQLNCRLDAWKVFLEEARLIIRDRKITLGSLGDLKVNDQEQAKYLNRREQEQEHEQEGKEEKMEEGFIRRHCANSSCSAST